MKQKPRNAIYKLGVVIWTILLAFTGGFWASIAGWAYYRTLNGALSGAGIGVLVAILTVAFIVYLGRRGIAEEG